MLAVLAEDKFSEFGLKKKKKPGVRRAALALVPEKLPTQRARRQEDRTAVLKVKVLLTLLGREGGGGRAGVSGGREERGRCDRSSHLNKESETGGLETGPRRCVFCLHFLPSVSFLSPPEGLFPGRPGRKQGGNLGKPLTQEHHS